MVVLKNVCCQGCGEETDSRLCCPKCSELGRASFFCSQTCFRKSWAAHNRLHKVMKPLPGLASVSFFDDDDDLCDKESSSTSTVCGSSDGARGTGPAQASPLESETAGFTVTPHATTFIGTSLASSSSTSLASFHQADGASNSQNHQPDALGSANPALPFKATLKENCDTISSSIDHGESNRATVNERGGRKAADSRSAYWPAPYSGERDAACVVVQFPSCSSAAERRIGTTPSSCSPRIHSFLPDSKKVSQSDYCRGGGGGIFHPTWSFFNGSRLARFRVYTNLPYMCCSRTFLRHHRFCRRFMVIICLLLCTLGGFLLFHPLSGNSRVAYGENTQLSSAVNYTGEKNDSVIGPFGKYDHVVRPRFASPSPSATARDTDNSHEVQNAVGIEAVVRSSNRPKPEPGLLHNDAAESSDIKHNTNQHPPQHDDVGLLQAKVAELEHIIQSQRLALEAYRQNGLHTVPLSTTVHPPTDFPVSSLVKSTVSSPVDLSVEKSISTAGIVVREKQRRIRLSPQQKNPIVIPVDSDKRLNAGEPGQVHMRSSDSYSRVTETVRPAFLTKMSGRLSGQVSSPSDPRPLEHGSSAPLSILGYNPHRRGTFSA